MQEFAILAGLPGSGKSTLARRLKEQHGFQVVSADAIRFAINAGIYPLPAPRGNYSALEPTVQKMLRLGVEDLLRTGLCVAVDATNLSRERRRYWLEVARAIVPHVPATIWWCTGDRDSALRWEIERGYTLAEYLEVRARLLAMRQEPETDEGLFIRTYPDEDKSASPGLPAGGVSVD